LRTPPSRTATPRAPPHRQSDLNSAATESPRRGPSCSGSGDIPPTANSDPRSALVQGSFRHAD
jgi:hypothetical protein